VTGGELDGGVLAKPSSFVCFVAVLASGEIQKSAPGASSSKAAHCSTIIGTIFAGRLTLRALLALKNALKNTTSVAAGAHVRSTA
jgi:hypothetical protein